MTLTKKDVTNKCGCPNQDVDSLVLRVRKFAKTIGLEYKFDSIEIVQQIVLCEKTTPKSEHYLSNDEIAANLALCTDSGYLYEVAIGFAPGGHESFKTRLSDGVVQRFFTNIKYRMSADQIGENATETLIEVHHSKPTNTNLSDQMDVQTDKANPNKESQNCKITTLTELPFLADVMIAKIIHEIHEGAAKEPPIPPTHAFLGTLNIEAHTPYLKTKVNDRIKSFCSDGYLVQDGKFNTPGKPSRYRATKKGADFVMKFLEVEIQNISEDLSNLSIEDICQRIEALQENSSTVIKNHKKALSDSESKMIELQEEQEQVEAQLSKIIERREKYQLEQAQIKKNLGLHLKENDAIRQKYIDMLTK